MHKADLELKLQFSRPIRQGMLMLLVVGLTGFGAVIAAPRIMPLVLGEARESWRCPAGGAEHTRSSLSVVQMDAAPVSTAAVASSRPREHPEGPPSAWFVVGGSYIKS